MIECNHALSDWLAKVLVEDTNLLCILSYPNVPSATLAWFLTAAPLRQRDRSGAPVAWCTKGTQPGPAILRR